MIITMWFLRPEIIISYLLILFIEVRIPNNYYSFVLNKHATSWKGRDYSQKSNPFIIKTITTNTYKYEDIQKKKKNCLQPDLIFHH